MQNKDTLKVSVLRMLLAAISNQEKAKRARLSKSEKDIAELEKLSQLNDDEALAVLSSEVKKRNDSIEQYGKGGRRDLAEQEKKELEILMAYMPEQMGENEIRKVVKGKIKELGVSGPQDGGRVMSQVMPQLKGRADGNLVRKIVQEELKAGEKARI